MKVAELASRCEVDGIMALSHEERTELRSLYFKEARKGAFRPLSTSADSVRAAFCAHVQKEFGPAVLTVIDCLPYFRRKASEQLGDPTPLAALILYATWIEHWVNVMTSVGMQRQGCTDADVEAYFALQPRFKEKVDHLGGFCSAPLPPKPLGWLFQVMKTRARYHHYVWKGMPQRRVEKDFKGLASLTRKGEEMIGELLDFEYSEFDAPLQAFAFEVFPPAR